MKRVRLAAWALLSLPATAFAAGSPDVASAPAVSAAGSLLQVFIGLVAVLLLIAATAWVAKRFGVARGGASSLLQVISSASVGTRERIGGRVGVIERHNRGAQSPGRGRVEIGQH
jgi:flagellar protein FliO/FliZ